MKKWILVVSCLLVVLFTGCEELKDLLGLKDEVIEVELIVHYSFDENSGTTANDSVGSNNGTISGATWTTGKIGSALSFDGIDDEVRITNNDKLNIGFGSFAIEAWVYQESSQTAKVSGAIVAKGDPNNSWQYYLCIKPDDSLSFGLAYSTDGSYTESAGQIPYGQWTHVALVRDGGMADLFINGEFVRSKMIFSTAAYNDGKDLCIGSFLSNTNWYFKGKIDEIKIYDNKLSRDKVREHYQE